MNWRDHPRLRGRLLEEYPDDLQVVVHDGGPRLTDRRPEAVWVRTTAASGDVFTGEVLNAPDQLQSVRQGDSIQFVVATPTQPALMVRPKYLAERGQWVIHACDKCGSTELFDAPSDLIAKVFPSLPAGEVPEMFTAFCGLCGGVQGVERAGASDRDAVGSPSKRWWQFWR